jgi:hypothetical protein
LSIVYRNEAQGLAHQGHEQSPVINFLLLHDGGHGGQVATHRVALVEHGQKRPGFLKSQSFRAGFRHVHRLRTRRAVEKEKKGEKAAEAGG